ncbi:MAG: hypothetical protein DWH83_03220 [Planctomycetota bacterium]|jgi:hypothetical protein|nr:MAG: hypothetical protein DWH83_03220 [Planctomycetota bacterium]
MVEFVLALATLLATGIEAAYVPADEGGGDYLVRVEPDLVKSASTYQFTSDVPADARDVRRVRIFVGDAWPPAVERAVLEASRKPRRAAPVAVTSARLPDATAPAGISAERPWGWLIGSLIALFMSLGANGYLSMLLAQMRQRYLRDIQQGVVRV